jgi:hypothetical protein
MGCLIRLRGLSRECLYLSGSFQWMYDRSIKNIMKLILLA